MKKRILIFVILFQLGFLIVGCTRNRAVELNQDVEEGKKNEHLIRIDSFYSKIKDTIRLSQITDSLFYVPLQSTDPYKMDGVKKLQLADSFIFIQTPGSDLFMFTMKGKFIRKINDGLTTCFGFDVLEKDHLIFVMSNKKIVIYDYEGKIKKQIRINGDWGGIGYCIAGIDSSSVAISLWNNGIRTARLIILNTDGKIVKEFPNPETFQSPHLSVRNASAFQRSLFHYQDGIRYHPYYCDTLFTLTDNLLKPVFIEKNFLKFLWNIDWNM
ncbi:6-bladed beta-propeller [Parabacteroides pacaensis]|uniref:6-bladed beta-propeller n=1 Tax=Parabacteroides pacaensis TaxID=2086575 RepID=UPI000D0E6627|nr:6-bladed beta-propeller [Parabacteroides pacaensis]